MKIKRIMLVVLFSIAGLSFVYANDSIVSIIQESKVRDVKTVGHELCRLFFGKQKGYLHQLKNYIWGTELEEQVAMDLIQLLIKNPQAVKSIFSGKASENRIIRDLQEGCFDYLSEAQLAFAYGLRNYLASCNETVQSAATIHCVDASNNEIVKGERVGQKNDNSNLIFCTKAQVNSHKAIVESEEHWIHYEMWTKTLGIDEARIRELDLQIDSILNNKKRLKDL